MLPLSSHLLESFDKGVFGVWPLIEVLLLRIFK
jgi:hypothetical protein